MPNILFDTLFAPHTGRDAPFLYLPDASTITYAAFLRETAQYANALVALGVGPGDRVAVHINKSAQALALYAGCVQAGAVFLPLNTAYTTTELEYFVGDSGAALFVCDPDEYTDMVPIAKTNRCALHTLSGSGTGTLPDLAVTQPTQFETVSRAKDDLAALLYTSGTTGRSKGAMLTHDNLLSNAEALVTCWRFTKDDVLLHALPIFHSHGLFVATNVTLLAAGAMIYLPKFDQDAILHHLPNATTLMGVPTFYTRLLNDARFTPEMTAHMRLFISGSAPLLAETHTEFETRTGHRILERYGMTETSLSISNPYDGERREGTVGFAMPGIEVKICDPKTGSDLQQGEIGVLEVRGPNVFKGYWKMPEKTRAELRENGFFITGDLARFDEDGFVQIVGRDKDLIISGGYNIYPKEIEVLLDAQDGVLESAVIGVPHSDFGESVVAVLVPKPGAQIDLSQIEITVDRELAAFKRPRRIELASTLPRNTMGKVQKNQLREQFSKVFQPATT